MGCTASKAIHPPSHPDLTSDSSTEWSTPVVLETQPASRHRDLTVKRIGERSTSSTGECFDRQRTLSYLPDTTIRRSQLKLQHTTINKPAEACTEPPPNASASKRVDEYDSTAESTISDTEPPTNQSTGKQVDEAISSLQVYLGSPLHTSDKVVRTERKG
jgi:hypothetical protein